MNKNRKSLIRNAVNHIKATKATKEDLEFLVEETKSNMEFVKETLTELDVSY
jgi:hypothetical protein